MNLLDKLKDTVGITNISGKQALVSETAISLAAIEDWLAKNLTDEELADYDQPMLVVYAQESINSIKFLSSEYTH